MKASLQPDTDAFELKIPLVIFFIVTGDIYIYRYIDTLPVIYIYTFFIVSHCELFIHVSPISLIFIVNKEYILIIMG